MRLRELDVCSTLGAEAEGVLCAFVGWDLGFMNGVDSSSGWKSFRLSSSSLSSVAGCWCCAWTIWSRLGFRSLRLKSARTEDSLLSSGLASSVVAAGGILTLDKAVPDARW